MTRVLTLLACLSVAALPAHAQGLDTLTDAAKGAADTLKDAAKDKVLVADMLGLEITGADGETVGTVENLVVVPGGKLVAALVKLQDGETLPVPYQLLKVETASEQLGVSLPVPIDELRGNEAVQSLTSTLGL